MTAFRLAVAAALATTAGAAAQTTSPPVPAQVIQLYSYGYSPNPIVLAAGRPVTLTFVNRAGKRHDFTAEKFFRASRILSGSVPEGEVDLRAGETARVTLIPAAGRYKAHCHRRFHKLLGMRADIVVH